MNKNQEISPAKLDEILAEIGEVAEGLAKSQSAAPKAPLKKDEPGEMPPEEPQAPPAEAAPEAPPAAPAEAAPEGAEEGAEAGAPPEAPGEMAEEMAPLSDEELQQIYAAMPPDELERHYMVIREQLSSHYQEGGQEAPPAEASPEAPSEAPQGAAPEQDEMATMKSENANLRKEMDGLKGQLGGLVKAVEDSFKPRRKSIEGIEFVKKSEADVGGSNAPQKSNLTKDEKKDELRKLVKTERFKKLSDGERQAISSFFLAGGDEEVVDRIIGGNK